MKKFYFAIVVAALCMTGCGTSKKTSSSNQNEVWQTLLVKQLDAQIDNQIITVKYNNGSTLCYKILDNFGNVSLTWDHTGGRKDFNDGPSSYKGDISIPSFIVSGNNEEFVFRVMEIDQNAFYGCSEVRSIDIPFSVLRIMNDAFKGCTGLEKFTVNENNQSYKADEDILFSKDDKMVIKYPAKKQTKEYVISEDASFICTEAFADNTYLEKITVGNFVTAISDYAFKNCKSLKTVELGGNVRIIGKESFFGCTNIELINSHGIFPPHNSPKVFEDVTKESAKLYVPKMQLHNYSRRLEWSDFKNISEY